MKTKNQKQILKTLKASFLLVFLVVEFFGVGLKSVSALQIYACIANDGKYACSPGNKSDLSDVLNGACAGKTVVSITTDQCGQTAPARAGNPNPGNTGNGNAGSTGSGNPGTVTSNPTDQIYNPLPEDSLTQAFLVIIQGFLGIVGIWAVMFIIVGGFQMVMASGNEEMYAKAKKTLMWAVLGLVIALLSFSIIAIVQDLLKANIQAPTSQNIINSVERG